MYVVCYEIFGVGFDLVECFEFWVEELVFVLMEFCIGDCFDVYIFELLVRNFC